MQDFKLLFSTSILLFFINANIVSSQKLLKVTVLYESLCPDSRNFFNNQLQDGYNYLKNYIDINYVPFGKSDSVENGQSFTCQHGPLECEGNLIQSCAINELKQDPDLQTKFTSCCMDYTVPESSADVQKLANTCANLIGISMDGISACQNSPLGITLQLEAERVTKSFYGPLKFVPTIVYDENFNQALQDESLQNFMGVICRLLHSKGIQNDTTFNNICGF